MRTVEQRIERLVCAEHCRYFKPWVTPEPDCGSMAWVVQLVGRRDEVLKALERLRDNGGPSRLAHDAVLLERICVRCQHYPNHCAYRRSDRSPDAAPCGGLMVLDRLLDRRVINVRELLAEPDQR